LRLLMNGVISKKDVIDNILVYVLLPI